MNAIGRICISALFIVLGVMDVLHWNSNVASLSLRMPAASLMLVFSMILKIGGGILLMTGQRVQLACIALIVFMVPDTLLYHSFWSASALDYQNQLLHFLKNLAIIGGLLVLLSPSKHSE